MKTVITLLFAFIVGLAHTAYSQILSLAQFSPQIRVSFKPPNTTNALKMEKYVKETHRNLSEKMALIGEMQNIMTNEIAGSKLVLAFSDAYFVPINDANADDNLDGKMPNIKLFAGKRYHAVPFLIYPHTEISLPIYELDLDNTHFAIYFCKLSVDGAVYSFKIGICEDDLEFFITSDVTPDYKYALIDDPQKIYKEILETLLKKPRSDNSIIK